MSTRLQALASGDAEPRPRGLGAWFAGRARRREYWGWVAPTIILGVTLAALRVPAASLIMGLPILFIWIRRLHDLGYSGWFAPVINITTNVLTFAATGFLGASTGAMAGGLIALTAIVVLGAIPGAPKSNEYGPPPGKRLTTEVFG